MGQATSWDAYKILSIGCVPLFHNFMDVSCLMNSSSLLNTWGWNIECKGLGRDMPLVNTYLCYHNKSE